MITTTTATKIRTITVIINTWQSLNNILGGDVGTTGRTYGCTCRHTYMHAYMDIYVCVCCTGACVVGLCMIIIVPDILFSDSFYFYIFLLICLFFISADYFCLTYFQSAPTRITAHSTRNTSQCDKSAKYMN